MTVNIKMKIVWNFFVQNFVSIYVLKHFENVILRVIYALNLQSVLNSRRTSSKLLKIFLNSKAEINYAQNVNDTNINVTNDRIILLLISIIKSNTSINNINLNNGRTHIIRANAVYLHNNN